MKLGPLIGAAAFCLALSSPAFGAVERFALIIGHNIGDRGEIPLQYAESDATKMHEVLSDLGGFRPENMVLLRGHDAGTVRRALISLNERIRARMVDAGVEPLLVVYYSGHADQDAFHLGGSRFENGELESLVRGSAAKFRLLIVDACRSGEITRVKGGAHVDPFPIDLDERLVEEGLVYLTSTSANEYAQESDELKGSFFTHYLVSGLTGAADQNGDGVVMLDEAYQFAYNNTIRATSRTIQIQHPTHRREHRGRNGIVMTRLDQASPRSAKLASRTGRAFLVMQQSSEGEVVAEIAQGERERVLYVRPGKYFVRSRAPDHLLEGEVEAMPGATVDLDGLPLARIEYARLVRKGGSELFAIHGVNAGAFLRTSHREKDDAICQGAFAGYTLDFEGFSLIPRFAFCRSNFTREGLKTTADMFEAQLLVRHAWDLAYFTVETGLGAGYALQRQSFASTGGGNPGPDRLVSAAQFSAGWAIGTDLPAGIYVSAEATAVMYILREESSATGEESLRWPIAGQLGVGLGKRW